MSYSHINSKGKKYFLHSKTIKRASGKETTLYFFAGDLRPEFSVDEVPAGKIIAELKSGLPVLKNIK